MIHKMHKSNNNATAKASPTYHLIQFPRISQDPKQIKEWLVYFSFKKSDSKDGNTASSQLRLKLHQVEKVSVKAEPGAVSSIATGDLCVSEDRITLVHHITPSRPTACQRHGNLQSASASQQAGTSTVSTHQNVLVE